MIRKRVSWGLISIIVLSLHCGLFEPEMRSGSLKITLIRDDTSTNLAKSTETLGSVQCVVMNGGNTVYNQHLGQQGNTFVGEISGLQPGRNYSVLLYGKNADGHRIARGYESNINVSAGNQTDVEMTWSSFTPDLVSPVDGTTLGNETITFDWNDVGGAVAYEITIATTSSFGNYIIQQTDLTISYYSSSLSLFSVSDGTILYYWRVRAKDSQGNWGGWSDVWQFTLDISGPTSPGLTSPVSGCTLFDNTPTFSWTDVDDAVAYELSVDNDNNYVNPDINLTDITSSSYTPTSSLSDGTYYWKVRCCDELGNWGNWSNVWTLTINTQAPTLVSPANSSTITDDTPTFDWKDFTGAVEYEIIVARTSTFLSPKINQTKLTGSNYTATVSLLVSGVTSPTYYWCVRARDRSGHWGSWSEIWRFSVSKSND